MIQLSAMVEDLARAAEATREAARRAQGHIEAGQVALAQAVLEVAPVADVEVSHDVAVNALRLAPRPSGLDRLLADVQAIPHGVGDDCDDAADEGLNPPESPDGCAALEFDPPAQLVIIPMMGPPVAPGQYLVRVFFEGRAQGHLDVVDVVWARPEVAPPAGAPRGERVLRLPYRGHRVDWLFELLDLGGRP